MQELSKQEINQVSGSGIVYDVFYWFGSIQAEWDSIDWSEVDTSGYHRE